MRYSVADFELAAAQPVSNGLADISVISVMRGGDCVGTFWLLGNESLRKQQAGVRCEGYVLQLEQATAYTDDIYDIDGRHKIDGSPFSRSAIVEFHYTIRFLNGEAPRRAGQFRAIEVDL